MRRSTSTQRYRDASASGPPYSADDDGHGEEDGENVRVEVEDEAPLAIVGVIGLTTARRKQRS